MSYLSGVNYLDRFVDLCGKISSMETLLLNNEALMRTGTFAVVLVSMIVLEYLLPKKNRTLPRANRWITNLGLVVIDSLVLRLAFPLLAIGLAVRASESGWGLLNLLSAPFWLEVLLGVVLLDLAVYLQHLASHKIPLLWSVHKVHHADRDIDASTGLRFHPIEIALSMVYKMLWVLLLGPSALAVLLFEVLLNASALFNHANLSLTATLDRIVRSVFVTPDMHRVHHSILRSETDSNYGFNLSIWDRLFNTYCAQPAAGHQEMIIGLPEYQSELPANIIWSLQLPFKKRREQFKKDV